ncbi:MAG: M1 family aminopeptidase [Ignavibacteriae bacterium]|nr:M1 family aminopeptidase [Ignavibacteriota bacterium]
MIAHEIAHQWIGDMVTIDSFADLWIIEGLASYAEALWAETKSRDEYEFKMEYFKYNYISLNSTQVIYDPEISNHSLSTSSLYDAGIVYCKSACVFHMFRNVVGDSIFFTILKSFFSEEKFRHKTVSTEQFVKYINEKSNKNYNWFFNAWLNQSYHPVYKFNYTISKADSIYSRIMINISQESTSFFPMLIEIRIIDENKVSNTIRIMNDKKNQTVQLKYKGKPKQIIFDPENKIILKDVNVRS